MTELIDTRLGQYQLTEVVGRGGMAVVYKAFQPSLERFVAIKLLLHNRDPQFAERFKREARTIANLQHPNILPIYDYGEQDGMLYLVLQYIENAATLGDMLGAQMEPGPALRLMARVLEALDYAHTRGIIHRDIKPSNILLLSPRWPMLADFGIAKLMSDDQRLTMSGMIVGTAAYMSPEQAAGRTVDARTDLYAVGIVLYELLTGRVPFEADTPIAVLIKQTYEPPPAPRSLNPALPEAVETALLRALAKDPADRYQSAGEMADVLERVAAEIERSTVRDQRADLYQSGMQAFEAKRWETAIDLFSRLVALDPSYSDAAQRLDLARQEQAAAQQQALRAGLYQAGLQAFEAKRWDAAIEQFDRLVALDPAYADAAQRLDAARQQQAVAEQQALRVELYQSGLLAFEAKRWDTAVEQFDRLVALDPAYADAAQRLDAARQQQVVAQEQAIRAGLYQAGIQAFQAGRWETAIDQFNQLVALDPEYEDASRWLENARKAQAYSLQQSARRGSDDLTQAGQGLASKPVGPAGSSPAPAP
ncbi:MAG TPA: serine/threonine-protein kinase, partial [Roseiflexaceae bacterium]|nr:serine/threonine-protein kinase [Roseiflexaceae bacterium]